MYHYIKCPTCNNSICEYYQIFNFIKEKKINEIKTKTSIYIYKLNENLNISFDDIFKLLQIDKMCCKKSIYSNIEYHSLTEFDI